MFYKIEIQDKPGVFDAVGSGVKKDIADLGIKSVRDVRFIQVYNIEANIPQDDCARICRELLCDPVCQGYYINRKVKKSSGREFIIEVAYNPGVMDPVEESTLKGIKDLGIGEACSLKTSKKYIIRGKISARQLKIICEKLLYNKLIQHIVKSQEHSPKSGLQYCFNLVSVDILAATDRRLLEISSKGQLFLNLAEMRSIKDYFKKLGRNPTDCELETIAQTWSEHCWHKTFRGKIRYSQQGKGLDRVIPGRIDNLLKSTIMKVTKELNKPWCVSVFKDNSGVIRLDQNHNICFKVETHNHPSALEPFGGANTGIGGVIRDPMGTGLGAKPILNTDVFCFGLPDYPFSKVPTGALHPKRVMKGVVSGVQDYGNKMGIPTVNGAILFDEGFTANPLVYCGTVGIMPKDKSFKKTSSGDLVVVVGGRTGRDGIHGATFSSGELTHKSESLSGGAVQIGNPIQEKKMLDAILKARDRNLYSAITDCGAGGLSSAVGEMGAELGARVELDKVPLKYSGLSYMEIWISESQERMVLSVPPEKANSLLDILGQENVEAAVIGEFVNTGRLELFYQDNLVCSLDMKFLHEGLPRVEKRAVFRQLKYKEPRFSPPQDLAPSLLKLLSRYDICSKESVIRRYDHEVQGGSILKPLVGILNDGPSDAAVVRPLLGSKKAVVVSNGINFRYGFIDPYWMAASCIDEALRQVISVGGSLKELAILDNFCWGNPDKPDRLGGLVRAAFGCYDAAAGFGVPFISGKDSLYNEYTFAGKSLSIPGTILISAVSVMDDADKTVSMYFKNEGGLIYMVGKTYDELGGSHYYGINKAVGNSVPKVRLPQAKRIFDALSRATDKKLIKAMHDCSEGGLGVSLAEMSFSGGLGATVFLDQAPYESVNKRDDLLLFSESNSRFIVEVDKRRQKEFEKELKGLPFGLVGCVSKDRYLKVYGLSGRICIKADINLFKKAWRSKLKW